MTSYDRERFRDSLGEWLIWRSTGAFKDFRMQVCINIIVTEGVRDGWIYQISHDDIAKILARYKEHVTFWNIGIDVIRNELRDLASALGRNYEEIASLFDSLPARRVVP